MAALSARMSAMMQQLMPKLAAMNQTNDHVNNVIDLSSAENLLLRDELRGILETAVSKPAADDDVLSLPAAFGGDRRTRSALAAFFNAYFRPANDVSLEHIVLTAGAGNCIETLVQSICDEGDSVLIPAPYWFGFEPYVSGRPKVNIIAASPSSNITHANELISCLETAFYTASEPSKIKALILCNPQNPFARCYPKNVILQCLDFCQRHGLHFISDELYALATIGAQADDQSKFVSALSFSSKAGIGGKENIDASRIHVIWSASKVFGLSGLRIGCLISQANPSIRAAVSILTYAGTSSLSAATLTKLLASPRLDSLLAMNSQRLLTSYSIFAEGFNRLGVDFIPATEGLFIFARIGKRVMSLDEENVLMARLREQGLTVSPGRLFNEMSKEFGWARITIAVQQEVAKNAMLRFERFYSLYT